MNRGANTIRRSRRRALAVLAFAGVAAMLGVVLPASLRADDSVVIERVVAVVNDKALFLSEVRTRALPFLESILAQPASDQERDAAIQVLYGRLTRMLIDEALIEAAALDLDVQVTTADVDRAIVNIRTQNSLTEDQFWSAIEEQGFSEATYRRDVRRQLLRLKVLNARARGRVQVTDEAVREAYAQRLRRASRQTCFSLSVRVFRAEDSSEGAMNAVCRQAQDVSTSVSAENFGGTDLGTVCEGAMQPQIEDVVRTLDSGSVSAPIRSEGGCLLVLLRERVTGATDLAPFEELEESIRRELMEQAMARQEQLVLEELRQDTVVDERL